MEVFHWIVVPISTVLGLSMARLLGGYVACFKARTRLVFDWLPLVFSAAVLAAGLQFWWALLELSARPHWALSEFTLLVAMILALFTAAALISPSEGDNDLRKAFEADGRWALVALSLFHVLAIVANALLWQTPLVSTTEMLELILAATCLAVGLANHRRLQEAGALLYLALIVLDVIAASVGVY
jgi:hypothetical protein